MEKKIIFLFIRYMLYLLLGALIIGFIASNKILSTIILAIMFGCYLGKKLANEL